jgi:CRISPR-associated exonuclease Cas4
MGEPITQNVRDKIKVGIENYRAASDAPAKVDIYDVIDEVFSDINPNFSEESKISIQEASGCLRGAYLDRKDPAERTYKQMISAIMEKGTFRILEKPAEGEVVVGDNIKLFGRADRVEDDVIMIFRKTPKLPDIPYAEHFMELNVYLHIFDKEEGMIIYFDNEGNETEFIIPKNQKLLNETLRRARILNTLLKNNILPALEPSPRCITCPYNEKCYYPSEDKQKWGFWSRGRWRELKSKPSSTL